MIAARCPRNRPAQPSSTEKEFAGLGHGRDVSAITGQFRRIENSMLVSEAVARSAICIVPDIMGLVEGETSSQIRGSHSTPPQSVLPLCTTRSILAHRIAPADIGGATRYPARLLETRVTILRQRLMRGSK